LFALFLEDVQATKDEDTFRDYQRWCTEFARDHGRQLARAVTRAQANDFKLRLMKATYVTGKQPPKAYSPKTVNHALITLRRAFNWAIETDRLPSGRNPFAGVKLLPVEGRRRVATAHCTDDAIRDVLVVKRHTAARPQDVYTLQWSMVDWEGRAWVLHDHKGRRTSRNPKPRVIGMCDEVERVLRRRLQESGGEGHVFRNADGRPWTKDALGLRMRRLRKRAGIRPDARGEQFVLYTYRHTFLTEAGADPGVSELALKDLGGHTDLRTTARYVHLSRQQVAEAGRRVAARLSSPGPASTG
jgi:integrase